MSLYFNKKKFSAHHFRLESELETVIKENSKKIFGENTIYIDAKKKLNSGELGKTIPDALFFDFSDRQNPKLYLVEVELAKHRFYDHIFPQITKFFAFLRDGNIHQSKLIESLFTMISQDQTLYKEFKSFLGDAELFKFLKDTIEDATDILILIDDDKKEFKEIFETYTDTWGKYVRVIKVNIFAHENEKILQLEPDFEIIKDDILEEDDDLADDNGHEHLVQSQYSEEYHLDGIKPEPKAAYYAIKASLEMYKLNPQHYYIAFRNKQNFVFIKFTKTKLRIIVMLPFDLVEAHIKNHKVSELSLSVQKFYSGKCSEIIVEGNHHIDEILKLLNLAATSEKIKISKD